MTATAALNDVCVEPTWSLSIFTFFSCQQDCHCVCHSAPSMCHGWRVRPSHAKHMVGETSGQHAICYREGCKTVRLPPLHYLESTSLSLLRAGGWHSEARECGFGPSSHGAASFPVPPGGDVIQTPNHQDLEIRGIARQVGDWMAWRRTSG